MVPFVLAALALVCLTLLLLLRPWRRGRADQATTAREINAGIYRDQLAELDRDLAAGTLAAADHLQAKTELQRRLLDDTALPDTPPARAPRNLRTSLTLAVAFPLLAAGLYAWLGTPAALLPGEAVQQAASAAEIDQMVGALAARLEKNPDDPKGWSMLARSYHVLGRFEESRRAFERVGDGLNRDPVLLADYADVLATLAKGNLEGRPLQLVMAALALDPDNQMALSLAATAAYKRGDFAQASLHWERLLKQLPPDSDDAKWLVRTLAEIRQPGEAQASQAAAGSAPSASLDASVSGRVSLAPTLAAKTLPTDTVFVFARAAEGPRMPLAVQRARVADLPLTFRLDDSMAVSPQFKLSSAPQLRIEARISRSGDATPAAGDLIGMSEPVRLGAADVALQIDRVRP